MKDSVKSLVLSILLLSSFISNSQSDYYKSFGRYDFWAKNNGEIGELLRKGNLLRDKPKERIKYVDIAYELTKKNKDSSLLPYIYFNYADIYFYLADDEKVFKYLDKIETLVDWNDLNFLLSRVYSYRAGLHLDNGNYEESILNQQKILNNSLDDKLIALANSNIATIFVSNNRFEIAKPYIDAVFNYYKNNTTEGLNHKNLAFLYQFLAYFTDNYNKKEELINKGIELTKERSSYNKVDALFYRANFFLDYNKYNKARNDYEEALRLIIENNIEYLAPKAYHSLAIIYLKQNKTKEAFTQLDSASKYIKVTDLKLKRNNTQLRYKAYSKLNDSKNAFFYAKEYIKYQDSILNNRTDSLYIAYGKKYQTEKKIQENELLKKDNEIKDLEVKKQTTNRNYLIGFSIMCLIALGAVYYRYRSKKKTAIVLAEQNTIISNQKIELEKSNANKQRLFGIIAHDLINPFNAVLGYTQLLEEDYESFNDKERKEFIATINKYANTNYSLTRTLLDWAKIQQDRLVVNKTILNCKEIVEAALQPYQVLADKKEIKVKTNILDAITIEADKNMMQTVIGNLFVNAVKFTPQKGEINLSLHKNKDGTINIEIADNGIGMTQEQLNNIFDITKVNTRKGTSNEKGNGLGLILSKELMELQKGTLQLFSQKNIGSRAVLSI